MCITHHISNCSRNMQSLITKGGGGGQWLVLKIEYRPSCPDCAWKPQVFCVSVSVCTHTHTHTQTHVENRSQNFGRSPQPNPQRGPTNPHALPATRRRFNIGGPQPLLKPNLRRTADVPLGQMGIDPRLRTALPCPPPCESRSKVPKVAETKIPAVLTGVRGSQGGGGGR